MAKKDWKIDKQLGRYNTTTAFERGLSVLGTHYAWGGSTPAGFDCSGFVSWCFFGKRVFVSDSAPSVLPNHNFTCQKFSYKKRKKGDIIYFPHNGNKPGHTAWYVADEGKDRGGPIFEQSGTVHFSNRECAWTGMAHPKEGWGVCIDHFE